MPSDAAEVFAALPVILVLGVGVALDFSLFDVDEVVNESVAESRHQSRVGFQGLQCLAQAGGDFLGAAAIRRVGGRRSLEAARDAVQPGVNLRGQVEIRVGSGLAQSVFDARAVV